MSDTIEETPETQKKTRSRSAPKASVGMTEAEKKHLEARIAQAEEDIVNKRKGNADRDQWYAENSQRYRCKVLATGARKGEKTAELFYEDPKNPNKPIKANIKLGVWLEKGLPMYVIQRLQDAYDTSAEEKQALNDPLASAGTTHIMGRTPRFTVTLDPSMKPISA